MARACISDGVPSLRADGAPAILNRTMPTRKDARTWVPFIFSRTFHAGRPIRFSEDLAELARTLPPEVVRGAWIWRTGDGARLSGRAPLHSYRAPGSYLLTLSIGIPHGRTFTFDAALVRVGR